ncbi:class I SAM-dependent DNA methyltransferase [Patulibacter defluvii]|uniref:class I SAM-dependent DNA methyltransferase n=1 Tax=Patulibacter defluvii TaxID=3095358 RepID=UPI002A74D30A|nr:class I SAM-dependent methyltransferase [Patulibacter sp. DM4]
MPVPEPHADDLEIRLPRAHARAAGLDQDEEWCELVTADGASERLRFHDYDRIFSVPGLYERLFYEQLECCSPTVVRELLHGQLEREGTDPASLRILDLGAGNGMVGEELQQLGAGEIVAVDILPEARMAAERDRPQVYDEYHVCDLTEPGADVDDALRALDPTCLTTVAALGFGDIPPRAFANAFDYLADDAWLAMTIKDDFVTDEDPSGFSRLIRRMNDEGVLEVSAESRYRHRLAVSGEPLHYHAYVARKRDEIVPQWLDELDGTVAAD